MERRLSAILAADVVGYSRLMEQDEAATFERLRVHRKELFEPEIEKHHGRIFKLMGDGLLAEFGSVVDAVECAVALQRGMTARNAGLEDGQRLDVRMGVNLGDVIVEGEDRHGEGVNIAARLQTLADPGGIAVSRTVAENVKNKLGIGFEFLGEHQVKNIAEPVAVYRVAMDGAPPPSIARKRNSRRTVLWLGTAAAAALVIAIGAVLLSTNVHQEAKTTLPPPPPPIVAGAPTLAVLPFQNMSSDPSLQYFADGVTETLIAELARSPEIRVIARTSSDAYKGKTEDIRQIGRELAARYVVEGSVQKSTDKVRIVAQLIDATTGEHVWAERYDHEGSDALALQDEVNEKIVGTIAGDDGLIKKREYETAWGKDRSNLEEYDYYLRGHQLFSNFTKDDTLKAIAVWKEGLAKFPASSLLRVKLGWGYDQLIYGGWSDDIAGDSKRSFDITEQALASRDISPLARAMGHWLMAWLQLNYKRDFDRALQERQIALALSPNDPIVIATMGQMAIQAGKPDEAIASLTRDIPWDLNSPFASPYYGLGFAYFVKADYPKALEYLKQERNEDPLNTLVFLAATYAELGSLDEAHAVVAKIRAANPSITLELTREVWPLRTEADTERLIGALRKAGLPEK